MRLASMGNYVFRAQMDLISIHPLFDLYNERWLDDEKMWRL